MKRKSLLVYGTIRWTIPVPTGLEWTDILQLEEQQEDKGCSVGRIKSLECVLG